MRTHVFNRCQNGQHMFTILLNIISAICLRILVIYVHCISACLVYVGCFSLDFKMKHFFFKEKQYKLLKSMSLADMDV